MIKPGFITNLIYPKLTKKVKLTKRLRALPKKASGDPKGVSTHPKRLRTLPKSINALSNLAFTKTFSRNTLLLPFLLGKTFLVHNGKIFLKVLVSENMVGHKLGEFSQTRRRYYYKKGKKIKNSGNKKK